MNRKEKVMNKEKLKRLVAEMRSRTAATKEEAWYDRNAWARLCDELESCAEDPEGGPEKEGPKTSEDAMRGLGMLIGAGLGPALANYRGGSPNITVYVTCNGK